MTTENQVDEPSSSVNLQQKSTTDKTQLDTEDRKKETSVNDDLKN